LLHFYQQHCWNFHPASHIVLRKFQTNEKVKWTPMYIHFIGIQSFM
jgi:hypothetical protein